MVTQAPVDRRVYRRNQQERADLSDEVALLFTRRFGVQGAAFLRFLDAALSGSAILPADIAARVGALWTQAATSTQEAGIGRLRAILLEAQRRGYDDLLIELAQAEGVNARNRRQNRQFLRHISRAPLGLNRAAAQARIAAHTARLIAELDGTTAKGIDLLARRALREGQTAPELRTALRARFQELSAQRRQHWRPRMIGANEVVQSHEAGKARATQALVASGARVYKRWLSARDERVSDGCRVNDADGWIENARAFNSGHLIVPRHVN